MERRRSRRLSRNRPTRVTGRRAAREEARRSLEKLKEEEEEENEGGWEKEGKSRKRTYRRKVAPGTLHRAPGEGERRRKRDEGARVVEGGLDGAGAGGRERGRTRGTSGSVRKVVVAGAARRDAARFWSRRDAENSVPI